LAALVNGEYVFLTDYERQTARHEALLVEEGLDPGSQQGQATLAAMRRDVLDRMIDFVLLEQGGTARGVGVSDKELDAQVEADIAAGGGDALFDEWLQATDLTRQEYRRMLWESMVVERLLQAVTSEVPTAAEQVRARVIVVGSKEIAEEILSLLQQGGDFATLAREHSLDLATKNEGGDLGWFPRGWGDPELERVAFALQPGETSSVIRLGARYHVVQVVERAAAYPLPAEMYVDLQLAVFEQWLEELRMEAQIERFVGE
jgi:foldase protein PrsA